MAKENKISIKSPFSKLLNKATPPKVERKNNLTKFIQKPTYSGSML